MQDLIITLFLSIALLSINVSAQLVGGYALRLNATCPTEMTDCGLVSNEKGVLAHSCCPSGQVCKNTRGVIPVCCPDENNCGEQVEQVGVCADDTWDFYIAETNYGFCCTDGLVGYETWNFLGHAKCVRPGTPIIQGDSELNLHSQGNRDDIPATGAPTGTSPGRTTTTSTPIKTTTVMGSPSETMIPEPTTIVMGTMTKESGSTSASSAGPSSTSHSSGVRGIQPGYIPAQLSVLLLAVLWF